MLPYGAILCQANSLYRHEQQDGPTQAAVRSAGFVMPSPEGELLAIAPPNVSDVYLLQASPTFASVITCFSAETPVKLCSWSADGFNLLIATSDNAFHILDREGSQQSHVPPSKSFRRTPLCFVCYAGDWILAVSTDVKFYITHPVLQQHKAVAMQEHKVVRAVCYAASRSILVVVGDGSDAQTNASNITLTAWQLTTDGEAPQLLAAYGKPQRGAWFRSGSFSSFTAGWHVSVSPNVSVVAVSPPSGPPLLFNLEMGVQGWRFEHVPAFEGSGVVGVHHVDWWDDMRLAVVTGSGMLSVVQPPATDNLLYPPPSSSRTGCIVRCHYSPLDSRHTLYIVEGPGEGCHGAGRRDTWRLSAVREQSPQEMLQLYLLQHSWQEALNLAASYELDQDEVYRALWRSGPVSSDAISTSLAHMSDRQWVVTEALSRVAEGAEGARALLQYALLETERYCLTDVAHAVGGNNPLSASSPLWWSCHRLSVLQQCDRLETMLAMNNGEYFADSWQDWRYCPLDDAMKLLGSCGAVGAMVPVLDRHPWSVMPNILEVLDALPETMEPNNYAQLLHKVLYYINLGAPPAAVRPSYWVETRELADELRRHHHYGLLHATEQMVAISTGWRPPTQRKFGQWFLQRACTIDASTGQLSLALSLLNLGVSIGLGEFLEDAAVATRQLLSAMQLGSSGAVWTASLNEYLSLDSPAKLQLLLKGRTASTVAQDVLDCVVPYLSTVPQEAHSALLTDWLFCELQERPSWCRALIASESVNLAAFRDVGQLSCAVCESVYRWQQHQDWDVLQGMLDDVLMSCKQREAEGEEQEGEEQEGDGEGDGAGEAKRVVEEALARVMQTRDHLTACRLLCGGGVHTVMAEVRGEDKEAAWRMLRSLLARFSRSKSANSNAKWQEVWAEVQEIWQCAFSYLPYQELAAEFCRYILRSGNFNLAKTYLEQVETAEQVVVSAAREYFYSANTLSSNAIRQAQQCLKVLPTSPLLQQELDAIDAVLMLQNFGLVVLPVEYAHMHDKMELVQQLLDKEPGSYRDIERLMQLVQLMGMANEGQEVLLRSAGAAMKAGDDGFAQGLVLKLVNDGFAPAAPMAASLAQSSSCTDPLARQQLAAFALAHCATNQLLDTLQIWAAVYPNPPSYHLLHDRPSHALGRLLGWSLQYNHSPLLPDVGQAHVALGCMLALEDKAEQTLDEWLASPSCTFQQSQRGLLIGMSCMALKALQPASLELCSLSDSATAALVRLDMSPWALLEAARKVQDLPSQQNAARVCAERYSQMLVADRDSHTLKHYMTGDHTDGFDLTDESQRQVAVRKLASAAAQHSPGAESEKLLTQALDMARRHNMSTWDVNMPYMASLLVYWPQPAAETTAAVAKVEAELLEDAGKLVHELATNVYPKLDSSNSEQLLVVLRTLRRVMEKIEAKEGHLKVMDAAITWVRRGRSLVSDFKAKVFLTPLLQRVLVDYVLDLALVEQDSSVLMYDELCCIISPDIARKLSAMFTQLLAECDKAGLGEDLQLVAGSQVFVALICKLMSTAGADAGKLLEQHKTVKSYYRFLSHVDLARVLQYMTAGGPYPLPSTLSEATPLYLPDSVRCEVLHEGLPMLEKNLDTEDETVMAIMEQLQQEAVKQNTLAAARKIMDLSSAEMDEFQACLRVMDGQVAQHGMSKLLQALAVKGTSIAQLVALGDAYLQGRETDVNDAGGATHTAGGLVEAAIMGATQASLESITSCPDTHAEAPATRGVQHVCSIVECLEGVELNESWGVSREVVEDTTRVCRNTFWDLLQSFLSSEAAVQGGDDTSVELLELATSLSGISQEDSAAARKLWAGWLPPGTDASTVQRNLLYTKTMASLKGKWPHVSVCMDDVQDVDAMSALFMRLLEGSSEKIQYTILVRLLSVVWKHGLVGPHITQDGGGGSAELVPLHSCWRYLLSHMLHKGYTSRVLHTVDNGVSEKSTLMTQEECEAVVSAAADPPPSPITSATIALLLPHESIRHAAVQSLLQKPPELDIPFLVVLLSHGLLPNVAEHPTFASKVLLLAQKMILENAQEDCSRDGTLERCITMALVAALVAQGSYVAAARLVADDMRMPRSFANVKSCVALLGTYLSAGPERVLPEKAAELGEKWKHLPVQRALWVLCCRLREDVRQAQLKYSTDMERV